MLQMPKESRGIVTVEIHKTRISNVNYKKNDKRLLNVTYIVINCVFVCLETHCVFVAGFFFISEMLTVYALDILT